MSSKKGIWEWIRGSKTETASIPPASNDVRNLFSGLGLDGALYQEFASVPESLPGARSEVFIAPRALSRTMAPEETAKPSPSPEGATPREEAAPDARTCDSTPTAVISLPSQPTRPASFAVLRDWGERQSQSPAAAESPVVALASFTGGAGKSTLSAALGASLASYGQQVFIVGQTPYSPLAYYFGGPRGQGTAGAIHHHSYAIAGTRNFLDLVVGEAPTGELIRTVRERAPRSLVLMDLEASPQVDKELGHFDLILVPLRPDINALVTVERTEQALRASDNPPTLGAWYLLNQFDATRDLHIQVHDVLRQRLGERLLSFVIPLDNAVQEALANGQPPQIYRSVAPFCQGVERLRMWLEPIVDTFGRGTEPL